MNMKENYNCELIERRESRDVISMNMKENYNMRTERDLILCDVIPMILKIK